MGKVSDYPAVPTGNIGDDDELYLVDRVGGTHTSRKITLKQLADYVGPVSRFSGDYGDLRNKPTIPSKATGQLLALGTNDTAYVTPKGVSTMITARLGQGRLSGASFDAANKVLTLTRTAGDPIRVTLQELNALAVAVETSLGAQVGDAVTWEYPGDIFDVVAPASAAAPRIRLSLPHGKALRAVYDGGADITDVFKADAGDARVYRTDRDLPFPMRLLVVVA